MLHLPKAFKERRLPFKKTVPLFIILSAPCSLLAADSQESASSPPATISQTLAESENQPSSSESVRDGQRSFYEVLDDLLGDFEYDLKNGNVTGLKDISIRNIATSENIPPSFKSHLELLITEKILKSSKTHVIQCLPCRARKTNLNGDQVVISSPETNAAELSRIAKLSNIEHFLDVAFSFQPTGMVMSMYITDPESGNVIWSRSYNSETSRAAAFRRGVDYNQIDQARRETEYTPTLQTHLSFLYLMEPNIDAPTGCLGLGYRLVERYNNRKLEVGFEADYLAHAASIVNTTGVSTATLYKAYGLNLSLLFVHAWNFIGEEENYNQIRGSLQLGLGGTYASGYLSGLIRLTYEWRLAKHFGLSLIGGYRPAASSFFQSQQIGTIQGPEYGLGVNILF